MKISTKGRYGTRFMLEVALHTTEKPITIKEAALNQSISEKYLEQIIPSLKKAGLIRSLRGAQGGYLLNHAPEDITIGTILRALEGPLAPVDCVLCIGKPDSSANYCSNMSECVTIDVWQKVYEAVKQVVDHITLADLVSNYYTKQKK
jgi:Rrf2 family protein